MRIVGEPQAKNGRPTPLRVCGYAFRRETILSWMDSQQILLERKGSPMDRADKGWGYIVNSLGPHGISCWMIYAYSFDEHGKRSKKRSATKGLILGTNETEDDRLETMDMTKIESIHEVLNIPMGALGAPYWFKPAEEP